MCCDNWGMLLFYDWSDYSLTLCSVSHSICSSCCCDGRLPTPLPAFEAGNSIAIYVSPDLPKMKGTISQTSFPGSGSGGRQEILQHLAYLGIIINHCTSPFGFGGRPFSPPQKKSKAWGYPPPPWPLFPQPPAFDASLLATPEGSTTTGDVWFLKSSISEVDQRLMDLDPNRDPWSASPQCHPMSAPPEGGPTGPRPRSSAAFSGLPARPGGMHGQDLRQSTRKKRWFVRWNLIVNHGSPVYHELICSIWIYKLKFIEIWGS